MTYAPAPIDTQHVELPGYLSVLVELLAKNTHDVWAAKRLAEGWVYGPQRSDDEKHHPDLVPYDQLPESEKDYDRQMAMQTLKAIALFGYRIVRGA